MRGDGAWPRRERCPGVLRPGRRVGSWVAGAGQGTSRLLLFRSGRPGGQSMTHVSATTPTLRRPGSRLPRRCSRRWRSRRSAGGPTAVPAPGDLPGDGRGRGRDRRRGVVLDVPGDLAGRRPVRARGRRGPPGGGPGRASGGREQPPCHEPVRSRRQRRVRPRLSADDPAAPAGRAARDGPARRPGTRDGHAAAHAPAGGAARVRCCQPVEGVPGRRRRPARLPAADRGRDRALGAVLRADLVPGAVLHRRPGRLPRPGRGGAHHVPGLRRLRDPAGPGGGRPVRPAPGRPGRLRTGRPRPARPGAHVHPPPSRWCSSS